MCAPGALEVIAPNPTGSGPAGSATDAARVPGPSPSNSLARNGTFPLGRDGVAGNASA
jgi:hypothetical protein